MLSLLKLPELWNQVMNTRKGSVSWNQNLGQSAFSPKPLLQQGIWFFISTFCSAQQINQLDLYLLLWEVCLSSFNSILSPQSLLSYSEWKEMSNQTWLWSCFWIWCLSPVFPLQKAAVGGPDLVGEWNKGNLALSPMPFSIWEAPHLKQLFAANFKIKVWTKSIYSPLPMPLPHCSGRKADFFPRCVKRVAGRRGNQQKLPSFPSMRITQLTGSLHPIQCHLK